MFRNFIVTAIRIAFKQKLTTSLNIIGMALGIAVSMILIMHVRYELSYDKHVPNAERVFRVTSHVYADNNRNWAQTSSQLFYELPKFFPEVESVVRIRSKYNMSFIHTLESGEEIQFEEKRGFYADSTVFDVMGLELLKGLPIDFYNDIYSLVISESMAAKYFGDEDPIGKQLESGGTLYTVKGIFPDCPENSHLIYDYFIPFKLFKNFFLNMGYDDLYYARGWAGMMNYVRLKENADIKSVLDRMDDFTVYYLTPDYEDPLEILQSQERKLQPIRDIHLHSDLEGEIAVNGNITYIYIFIISIVFILIVVASNYVNIATSLALKRTKEIGIKKINGSSALLLKIQILSEALLTAVLGGILAILFIDLAIPYYNQLAGQQFVFSDFAMSENLLYFILMILSIGILSGLYPAFFITKFDPVMALKGLNDPSNKSNKVRKVLLVFQFVVSIFMIFATIGIYKQMKFFQNKNLGFDKENLLSVNVTGSLGEHIYYNSTSFKEELKKLPSVKSIAYSGNLPGEGLSVEMLTILNRDPELSEHSVRVQRVCKDYINTMGLELIDGDDFKEDYPQESRFIINERTAEVLQLEKPVGWDADPMFGSNGRIVGVVRDFHFASLHQVIEPIVLQYCMNEEMRGWAFGRVIIRLNHGNVKEGLEEIEKGIQAIVPDAIINFNFIDDYLNSLYIAETKMSNLFKVFTLFTIFIACLGLFGITAYNAELRTKEIGIRKVLGASNFTLVKYLSVKFIMFILISIVIALPLAYFFINNWLQNFAYHATLSAGTWIIAVVLSISVAFITILYHALRVAHKKPVDVLKYE